MTPNNGESNGQENEMIAGGHIGLLYTLPFLASARLHETLLMRCKGVHVEDAPESLESRA